MQKNQYLLILGAIALSAISFFAGTRYQLSKSVASNQFGSRDGSGTMQQAANGQKDSTSLPTGSAAPSGMGAAGQGGSAVSGEVTAKDDTSITIKTMDSSTKIIILADSTSYKQSVDASLSDLTVGETVNVSGTSNSDGSVTAKTVTIGVVADPIGQGRPNN